MTKILQPNLLNIEVVKQAADWAHPVVVTIPLAGKLQVHVAGGLTQRVAVAAQIAAGLLAGPMGTEITAFGPAGIARHALEVADALLAADPPGAGPQGSRT